MRVLLSGLVVLGVALGAQAQQTKPQPEWEMQAYVATEMCLRGEGPEADRGPDCRGIIYEGCPGNAGSTQDMVECSDAGLRFWDARLNASYRELMDIYRAEDAEDPESPYQLAPLLREAQRAWIAYRDANCGAFERYRFRGGTLGRLTSITCMSDMTADRAHELEEFLAETRI